MAPRCWVYHLSFFDSLYCYQRNGRNAKVVLAAVRQNGKAGHFHDLHAGVKGRLKFEDMNLAYFDISCCQGIGIRP